MTATRETRRSIPRKTTMYKRGERKMKVSSHGEQTHNSIRILDYLPSEIISEVVSHVGASSFADLVRCKLSCKALQEITKEGQVLQQVSLNGLPFFVWLPNKDANNFFKRCHECQNPEALFQLGTWQYFSLVVVEEGIANLEKAAGQGHSVAAYVLGLISLCSGDHETQKRGVSLINNIMEREKGKGIVECRKKLQRATREMWMNNRVIQRAVKPSFSCALEEQHSGVRRGWRCFCDYDKEWEDQVVCLTCRCRRELDFFFKLLPKTT